MLWRALGQVVLGNLFGAVIGDELMIVASLRGSLPRVSVDPSLEGVLGGYLRGMFFRVS